MFCVKGRYLYNFLDLEKLLTYVVILHQQSAFQPLFVSAFDFGLSLTLFKKQYIITVTHVTTMKVVKCPI